VSVSAEYLITENLYVGAGLSGRGSIYFDDSHDERSAKYNLLDARLGYQEKNFRVELWGRNLGNERYETRGFYFGNEPPNFEPKRYVQLGDPRAFGVSFSYDW
jgi:outer membrane receptor protein involved in Fe transport